MKLIILPVWFPALWETYSSGQILIMLWLTCDVSAINAASLPTLSCSPNMTPSQSLSTAKRGIKSSQLTASVRLCAFMIQLLFCSAINTEKVGRHDRSNHLSCSFARVSTCDFKTYWSSVPQLWRRHDLLQVYWEIRFSYQLAGRKGYIM